MLRIHWNFCVEVPCMEYLSLQASSKEDYSTHGVIFLAACPEGQMYHAWKFHVKVSMNTYPNALWTAANERFFLLLTILCE